jgi:hypothetical protein
VNAQDIIARNTRNGVTSWAQVAKQLGCSVDSARAQHDPAYARAHIWAPSREPQPEMEEIDESDLSSPHAKPVRLKVRILMILGKHTMSAATIAATLGTTLGCAKKELSVMKRDGAIKHTKGYPYTWSLTEAGAVMLQQLRRGNASGAGVAA